MRKPLTDLTNERDGWTDLRRPLFGRPDAVTAREGISFRPADVAEEDPASGAFEELPNGARPDNEQGLTDEWMRAQH